MKGGHAIIILSKHVCSFLQQHLGNHNITKEAGIVKGCVELVVTGIYVDLVTAKQNLYCSPIASWAGQMQW